MTPFTLLFILCIILRTQAKSCDRSVPNIIFETDIGGDVDDAMALDMIYKYMDEGKINLLAVCSNRDDKYSTEFIHMMNHFYGYPNIPIGKVTNGITDVLDSGKQVCLMKGKSGKELFVRPAFGHDALPDAVLLYRQILSKMKDKSVTVVSVGFSTNLARLLRSPPDKYSKLSGRDLVQRKVNFLSVMACCFREKPFAEYNVMRDVLSFRVVAVEWPTTMVYTPFEAGMEVLYPATVIETGFSWTRYHPVVEQYKKYKPMPHNNPCWDLIALLIAVENSSQYFSFSPRGNISVQGRGYTKFTENANGNCVYVKLEGEQPQRVLDRFIEITNRQPKNRSGYLGMEEREPQEIPNHPNISVASQ